MAAIESSHKVQRPEAEVYIMRISRMTIDKLGVRLHDRVSAVVAELVANAYDADAEQVTVRVPLGTLLARMNAKSRQVDEYDYVIEIEDDGHGMTPQEANAHFLRVGKDRRRDPMQGGRSRHHKRSVMGRKGIGKLAPFGICKKIEINSAGGDKTDKGYLVTHFIMDYDTILADSDEPVLICSGEHDRTYREESGTTVSLRNFLPKRVPDSDTFHRQLAVRFGLKQASFKIVVEDNRNPDENRPFEVGALEIPTMESTYRDISEVPVKLEDESLLPVTGWMALAKKPYKHEEMAGVRIYARGKIVATTRDFEQPAGYTGEFTLRSYLVGEVHADWLDEDDGEDLITTDRQDILWESDHGRALRKWGVSWIKQIGEASRKPRRQHVLHLFMDKSKLEEKANERFPDTEIIETAVKLGKQIGRFAAEDELQDQDYVDGLAEVVLSVAPHKALMEAFEAFNQEIFGKNSGVERVLDLFSKTRIAEMASYAQIASERVKAIHRLKKVIDSGSKESVLQDIIQEAPWLIEATWVPITFNQTLKLFEDKLENFYLKKTGQNVTFAINQSQKRSDFTLVNIGHKLHVVEIKAVNALFGNKDWDRLRNHIDAFEDFIKENPESEKEFPQGWVIDLVCDEVKITDRDKRSAYELYTRKGHIMQVTWYDFLSRAVKANELFLDAHGSVEKEADKRTKRSPDQ